MPRFTLRNVTELHFTQHPWLVALLCCLATGGCLGTSGESGTVTEGNGPTLTGGSPTIVDDRPIPSYMGEPTEEMMGGMAGGQPATGGELAIDIKPVSAVPGKPILNLTDLCQALDDEWDAAHREFEDQVLVLTNEARSQPRTCGQYGDFPAVPPVFPNELLRCAARLHCVDMVERSFFDHADPDGVGPDKRARDAGYPWVAVGENIAAGSNTPRKVVNGWIDSPGHCKNIMSPNFDELGVGYTPRSAGRFTHYWTQVFGRRR